MLSKFRLVQFVFITIVKPSFQLSSLLLKKYNSVLLLIFSFLISSCDFYIEKGSVGIDVAKNVDRSKELGIFINEFSPKEVVLNDTLKFKIVSAWVEYNIYFTDVEDETRKTKNWSEGNQWKLKEGFDPINKGHLSFLVKGKFKEKFMGYGKNWKFNYCHQIDTKDTTISNNYTYF